MPKPERIALWLTLAALIIAIFILSTHQATLEQEQSQSTRTTIPATTTSTTTVNPLAVELLRIKQEVNALQAHRGLTGPEVRALVETLLPAETCPEPPCTASTTAVPTTAASTTTTEKRRRR